jgi:hypothetical protein
MISEIEVVTQAVHFTNTMRTAPDGKKTGKGQTVGQKFLNLFS